MLLLSSDKGWDHEENMGNSFTSTGERADPEVYTYLNVYDYVIPFVATLIVLVNFSVVLSSGLLIKKGVEPRFTYLFLGNVALTDMIIGLAVIFGQFYPKTNRTHQICTIQMGVLVSSTLASIYSVGLLAIDRFLYIVYGIKYCKWICVCRVRVLVGLTWLMAITIGFLPSMGWSGNTLDGQICWFVTVSPPPLVLLTISIGIVPIILVVILYSIILYHAIANINKIQCSLYGINTLSQKIDSMENLRMFKGTMELPMKPRRKVSDIYIPQKWKAIKIVLFTTLSFLISWAPYFVACVIYVEQKCNFDHPNDFCRNLRLLIASPFTILGFMNSLVNPFIYAWWHNGFRSYVRNRVHKMCSR